MPTSPHTNLLWPPWGGCMTVPPGEADPFWDPTYWFNGGVSRFPYQLAQGLKLDQVMALWVNLQSLKLTISGSTPSVGGADIDGSITAANTDPGGPIVLSGTGAWSWLPGSATADGCMDLGNPPARACATGPIVLEWAGDNGSGTSGQFAMAIFIDPDDDTKFCVAYSFRFNLVDQVYIIADAAASSGSFTIGGITLGFYCGSTGSPIFPTITPTEVDYTY